MHSSVVKADMIHAANLPLQISNLRLCVVCFIISGVTNKETAFLTSILSDKDWINSLKNFTQ